jgi:hypothetical protein
MAPQMIESLAISQLTEHHETAARLRRGRQARTESRRVRHLATPAANTGHSFRSRLHLWAHPA